MTLRSEPRRLRSSSLVLALPLLLTCAALCLSACDGQVSEPPPPATCVDLAPVKLTASAEKVRVRGPVDLEASGGSGRLELSLEPGGSGGELRGDRFIAGPTPAMDVVVVKDPDCGGEAQVSIQVIAPFEVSPTRATVKPGTSFTISLKGLLGGATFSLAQSASGATLSALGEYTAGPAEGVDLIEVRDVVTGEQVLLRFEVKANAKFRGDPERLALPAGSELPLLTIDGTDAVSWVVKSGEGVLEGDRFSVTPGAQGTAELEATDAFTGEKAIVRVRVLDELTRTSRPHGRITDVVSIATADFDGDGIADVAVGRPESDLAFPTGGAVFIFKGAPAGLPPAPTWILTGHSETAQFGATIAAADFDADGRSELVVASPGDDLTFGDSGAVYLYRFEAAGPTPWRKPLTSLGRGNFGSSLAIADLDGDGDLDLAVGAPTADLAPTTAVNRRGVVDVFLFEGGEAPADLAAIRLGGADLNPDGSLVARSNVNLGRGIVAQDLNGDGRVDLAMACVVTNSLLDGVALAKSQTAVQVHLSRGGAQPFREKPDAYVLPINAADTAEGTWRMSFVPAGEGRPPLLVTHADLLDSPDLSAEGGNKAASNTGGALLFDLSQLPVDDQPPAQPLQLGRAHAYARFYGDQAGIQAGRSLVAADVDGVAGPELILGAPYAAALDGEMKSMRFAGKLLVFPLAGLMPGTAANKPADFVGGSAPSSTLGTGVAAWPLPGGTSLVSFAGRASTDEGDFVGRAEAFLRAPGSLAAWARSTANVPAKPSSEQFGAAVALTRLGTSTQALVGAPGRSGPGVNNDGNDVAAGAAFAYDAAAPSSAAMFAEGAFSPLVRGGRALGTSVGFTDFDGDGRRDALVGIPNQQVPGTSVQATEVTPNYVDAPGCLPATTVTMGGVQIHQVQANGSFIPAFRLWAPQDIPGCTPAGVTPCRRAAMGREVAGGFDFNGDGKQDVLVGRTGGLDVFLGRAPADSTLAKMTIACDPAFTTNGPSGYRTVDKLSALGDLDADGCDEIGWRYADTNKGGYAIAFGFDASGARCGGKTQAAVVRLSGDSEAGLTFMNFGLAAASAGRVLGGTARQLAISAGTFPVDGRTQPAVLLFDVAELVARRPASGEVVLGVLGDGLTVTPLTYRQRLVSFGTTLASVGDVTGDGVHDLVVGAPGASYASDGGGVLFVFAGGATPEPFLIVPGDVSERAQFAQALDAVPASMSSPASLVIGAPRSNRTGTANGTAFWLPLAF